MNHTPDKRARLRALILKTVRLHKLFESLYINAQLHSISGTDVPVRTPQPRPIIRSRPQELKDRARQSLADLYGEDAIEVEKELLRNYFEVRPWFFDSAQYENWRKGKPWQLHCYGESGCGKTTFAAAVAEKIRSKVWPSNTAVVTVFLDRLDRGNPQFVQLVMRNMLRQILQSKYGMELPPNKASYLQSFASWSQDTWNEKFLAETADLDEVFLIVDDLDKCVPEMAATLEQEFKRFLDRMNTRLRLMVLQSRPGWAAPDRILCDINSPVCQGSSLSLYWHCDACKGTDGGTFHMCYSCYAADPHCPDGTHPPLQEPYKVVGLTMQTTEQELTGYIKYRLDQAIDSSTDAGKPLPNAKQVVENAQNTIATKSAGAFLIARLYMEYVTSRHTLEGVLTAIDQLPDTEIQYFDSLRAVVGRQSLPERRLATEILDMVSAAWSVQCPLSWLELADALKRSDSCADLTRQKLLDVTKGFLVIEPSRAESVMPFHPDVGVYLNDNFFRKAKRKRIQMAKRCIDALVSAKDGLANLRFETADMLQFLEKSPFLDYSLRCWVHHCRQADSQESLKAADDFLSNDWAQPRLQQLSLLKYPEFWAGHDKLHIAARFDLTHLASRWLKLRCESALVNMKDRISSYTPLMIACSHGNLDIVKLLLDAGADSDHVCASACTALWYACTHGHHLVVQELLRRANKSLVDYRNPLARHQTALMTVIRNIPKHAGSSLEHQLAVIEVIMEEADIQLTQQDDQGWTALHWAANVRDPTLLKQILQHANAHEVLNTPDKNRRTALMVLFEPNSARDFEPMCDCDSLGKMLDHGVDCNIPDISGRTALHSAVATWAVRPVEILLQSGSDIGACDEHGWSALHLACALGIPETVDFLLEKGADRNLQDKLGRTPGDIAGLYDNDEVSSAIGFFSASKSNDNPLWEAMRTQPLESLGDFSNIEFHECDIISMNTALHCAVASSNLDMIRLLLEDSRTDINATNVRQQTALMLAFYCQQDPEYCDCDAMETIIALLLSKIGDMDLDLRDSVGDSTLDYAINYGGWKSKSQLLCASTTGSPRLTSLEGHQLLRRAVEIRDVGAATALLRSGVDVLQHTPEGQRLSELAAIKRRGEEMVKVLEEAEYKVLARLEL